MLMVAVRLPVTAIMRYVLTTVNRFDLVDIGGNFAGDCGPDCQGADPFEIWVVFGDTEDIDGAKVFGGKTWTIIWSSGRESE